MRVGEGGLGGGRGSGGGVEHLDVANSPQKGIGNLSRSAGTRHRDGLKYFVSVGSCALAGSGAARSVTRKAIVSS